ncbi:MAG: ATP-binding protein [Anaerolineae bacterium]|nr:ATP-binding protein [Anaerolineae bacterium]NUQ06547.1 two-component sensor histidine kinase [Anaerolineae bacterium]
MADYTREQFADEVRSDRLNSLIRWTIIGGGILIFALVNIALIGRAEIIRAALPVGLAVAGALATRALNRRTRYNVSAGFFVSVLIVVAAVAMFTAQDDGRGVVPFLFPLIVFIVGTLFPPIRALQMAIIAALLIILVPVVRGDGITFGWQSIAAITLAFGAAGIAALVTADLYQIAEWAIFNYSRERRIAGELFDNRIELERSLARTRALSENLQDANVQLDAARLSAEEAKHFRGQFLANMSHELRTPLNAIIGFSETMLKFPAMYDGVKLPGAYEVDLNQIYVSGQELLKLINDILDLSKVDAGKLEIRINAISLTPIIEHVMSTSSGLVAKKPIKLVSEVPPVLPLVLADDQRVRQVLFNLYSNAAKFTDRGTITVGAQVFADLVQVYVSDSGSGIAPENHEIIFEEFKQAQTEGRDPRSGAGLGLAISRQLLTLMNGRIWVESALGKGSTFHFTLPRADVAGERQDGDSGASHHPSLASATVDAAGTAQ